MSGILDTLFDNLSLYIWNNPLDNDDFGVILIESHRMADVLEFTDYSEANDSHHATSFRKFIELLDGHDIPFYVMNDVEMYVYTE